MNTLIKRLPLLGFVLAGIFAFAFTQPNAQEPAYQLVNGVPTDVSTMNYRCDFSDTQICTFEDVALTIPKEDGEFWLNP
ncbi:hypothetical protein EGN73_03420 [Arthrospiribacter ruber]|uniref:Uncharacterized protein n=2 Tax=Arthrospiribacter ruber TaxID=2487934 RepID=A0A951ISP0_9BACT|nr:hypothetical protein [Arthrospiribacter ruber]